MDLELLDSQKTAIFNMLQTNGLNPRSFSFENNDKVLNILNIASGFYFLVRTSAFGYVTEIHPSEKVRKEIITNERCPTWDMMESQIQDWIDYMNYETSVGNKWKDLESNLDWESSSGGIMGGDNFNETEIKFVTEQMENVKSQIPELGLTPDQTKQLSDKIDELIKLIPVLPRNNWFELVKGAVAGQIASLVISKETATTIWSLFLNAFNTFFLN
jgi:hypothetical protein